MGMTDVFCPDLADIQEQSWLSPNAVLLPASQTSPSSLSNTNALLAFVPTIFHKNIEKVKCNAIYEAAELQIVFNLPTLCEEWKNVKIGREKISQLG